MNVNGIQNSAAELLDFMIAHSVKVACIQETKLSARSRTPSFPDYAVIRRDRPTGGGGGLMILVQHDVKFSHIDTSSLTNQDPTLEILGVTVTFNGSDLDILNLYIPPISSCPPGYSPNFPSLLDLPTNDALFFGDFNAHHSSWYSPRDPSDPRGDLLASALDSSTFAPLNCDSYTRLPFSNSPSSSPDISLAPVHLLSSLSWSVHTKLNSDHLPILVSFRSNDLPPRTHRSFTNFRLANWVGFVKETEDLFAALPSPSPSSCAKDEKTFRDILLRASKHNIPSGFRRNFIPGLPPSAKDLIAKRDELRSRNSVDPAISLLNDQI